MKRTAAHPLDSQSSFSLAVGEEFIEAYRQANPTDEVVHLDLYQEYSANRC